MLLSVTYDHFSMQEPSTWGRPNQRHLRASSIDPALVTMHTQAVRNLTHLHIKFAPETINWMENMALAGWGGLWLVVTLVPTL